jgi:hypothetical protein
MRPRTLMLVTLLGTFGIGCSKTNAPLELGQTFAARDADGHVTVRANVQCMGKETGLSCFDEGPPCVEAIWYASSASDMGGSDGGTPALDTVKTCGTMALGGIEGDILTLRSDIPIPAGMGTIDVQLLNRSGDGTSATIQTP